jgi:hypothetical protein
MQFLNAKGTLVSEINYNKENDPASIRVEEETYSSTRKGPFMLASEWEQQATIEGNNMIFSYAFYMYYLSSSRFSGSDNLENIPELKRRKPLKNSRAFTLFLEIEEFMRGERLKDKTKIKYRDNPKKILEFLENGMSPEYFSLVADNLKQEITFLQKAIRKNALILEHLEADIVKELLKKRENARGYLQDVKKYFIKSRRPSNSSRRGKIPLLDSGKASIDQFVSNTSDALEFITIFHPLYGYLKDEHANDRKCIDLLMNLRKPYNSWSADFLYGQALIRRNFYAGKTGMNARAKRYIRTFPELLELLPAQYRRDRDLILELLKGIKSYSYPFPPSPVRFASAELLDDENFVFQAVEAYTHSFGYLPEKWRSSLDFFTRIQNLPKINLYGLLEHVTESLLDNEELWKRIPDNKSLMNSFASQRIKDMHGIPVREQYNYDDEDFLF